MLRTLMSWLKPVLTMKGVEEQIESEEMAEAESGTNSPPLPREIRKLTSMYSQWKDRASPTVSDTRTRYGRAITQPSTRLLASDPNAYDPFDMHQALTERVHLFIHRDEKNEYIFQAALPTTEPSQFKDAVKSPEVPAWWVAMKDEINSLIKLGVWNVVKRPSGVTLLKGRWVYKNKLGDNNQLLRRKARFVAKGFMQMYGRDFFETHSPVAKMKSIKLMLSLAAKNNMEIHQMDFDTAFLNATVKEDIYMEQPEGFHVGDANMVLKLNKALYGLKQAPREWNKTIDKFMRGLGYQVLRSDPCVYIKRSKTNKLIIICLYVDDTVFAFDRTDAAEWKQDKEQIANAYAIKDLGECKWILNMKVTRDQSQPDYYIKPTSLHRTHC